MVLGTNLRTLKLDMFYQRTSYWYEKGNFEHALAGKAFVTEFPFFLAPFKSLEYVSLELPIWCANIPRRHRIVDGMIRRIALKLQAHVTLSIPAKRQNCGHRRPRHDTKCWQCYSSWYASTHPNNSAAYELWTWEARAGRTVDWSQVAHIGIPYNASLFLDTLSGTSADHCVFEAGFYLAFVEGQFLLHDGNYDHTEGYFTYKVREGPRYRRCVIKGHEIVMGRRH